MSSQTTPPSIFTIELIVCTTFTAFVTSRSIIFSLTSSSKIMTHIPLQDTCSLFYIRSTCSKSIANKFWIMFPRLIATATLWSIYTFTRLMMSTLWTVSITNRSSIWYPMVHPLVSAQMLILLLSLNNVTIMKTSLKSEWSQVISFTSLALSKTTTITTFIPASEIWFINT